MNKPERLKQTSCAPEKFESSHLQPFATRKTLTCRIMAGVCTDVLEDERTSRCHDENLQHKVVQRLEEDLAEGLGFERLAVVVAEEVCSLREVFSRESLSYVHFKLVTDAFDFCLQKKFISTPTPKMHVRLRSRPSENLRRHLLSSDWQPIISSSNILLLYAFTNSINYVLSTAKKDKES